MCGVALAFTRRNCNANIMRCMLEALQHRGPDKKAAISFELKNSPEWVLSMGHTRLSIVGLGEIGNQPKFKPNQFGMIFNGEIYGPAAGQSLREAGIESDTHWLWQNYEKRYEKYPQPGLDGVWGIVSYDATEEVISVTRDPLGVIPIYAYEWKDGLVISSEIQAISKGVGSLPVINSELIRAVASRQLSYGRYIRGLSCISPGETRTYKIRNNSIISSSLCDDEYLEDYINQNSSFSMAFNHAIYKQFQADVPLGIQLSGGVDSTLIAATLVKHGHYDLNTFVARTNKVGKDEADFAIANARRLGLKPPTEVLVNKQTYSDELLNSIGNIDPAFSHPNFFAIKKIARTAHEQGVKVLLCGEGADELFRGYSRLLPSNLVRLFNSKISYSILKRIDFKRLNFDQCLPKLAKQEMITNSSIHYQWVKDESMRHLFSNYLHELLYRQNIAGMAHSVEIRPPFLDFDVVGYAIKNQNAFFSIDNNGIKLLKGAVKSHLLNIFPNYVGPRRKSGFSMPLHELLDDDVITILEKAVNFSKNELGVDRSFWFKRYMRSELDAKEFERTLWPAIITFGALASVGQDI